MSAHKDNFSDSRTAIVPLILGSTALRTNFSNKIEQGQRIYARGRIGYTECMDEHEKQIKDGKVFASELFICDSAIDRSNHIDFGKQAFVNGMFVVYFRLYCLSRRK